MPNLLGLRGPRADEADIEGRVDPPAPAPTPTPNPNPNQGCSSSRGEEKTPLELELEGRKVEGRKEGKHEHANASTLEYQRLTRA